jgi:hypothetical protein
MNSNYVCETMAMPNGYCVEIWDRADGETVHTTKVRATRVQARKDAVAWLKAQGKEE